MFHTKFHLHSFDGPLAITIKLNTKNRFHRVAILFYTIQRDCINISW